MASTDMKRLLAMIGTRRGAGGRVPRSAQAEIAAEIERAHAAGASYSSTAAALGLTLNTVTCWRRRRTGAKLVAVRVPLPASSLVVYGPRGLRIEGLSIDDVTALLARLS
jgi:hypothetical protein